MYSREGFLRRKESRPLDHCTKNEWLCVCYHLHRCTQNVIWMIWIHVGDVCRMAIQINKQTKNIQMDTVSMNQLQRAKHRNHFSKHSLQQQHSQTPQSSGKLITSHSEALPMPNWHNTKTFKWLHFRLSLSMYAQTWLH